MIKRQLAGADPFPSQQHAADRSPIGSPRPLLRQAAPKRPSTKILSVIQLLFGPRGQALGRWQLSDQEGIEVAQYSSAELAHAAIKRCPPDAIICSLDDEVADRSGIVQRLRLAASDVPIVAVLDVADSSLFEALLLAGADDVVVRHKVLEPALLHRAVHQAVEQRVTKRQLGYLSRHDRLTGSANREQFADRLQLALDRAHCSAHQLAVLVISIDRFRTINETYGATVGDAVLINTAQRLREIFRPQDTVARTGSGEFSVLLESIGGADELQRIMGEIDHSIDSGLHYGGRDIAWNLTVGSAVYPIDGTNLDDLVRAAGCALARAKTRCRSHPLHRPAELGYDQAGMPGTQLAKRLNQELAGALAGNQFELHYQPRIDLRNGHIRGVEALIRWRHPELGCLLPAQFVPLAERNGFIVNLGRWVLHQACADIVTLKSRGAQTLNVAVNLSAQQFLTDDLATNLAALLEHHAIHPQTLTLEITESTLMADTWTSGQQRAAINAMGIEVYLDDFGTGYSSLAYLKRFQLQGLKIDRSFLTDIASDVEDQAITRAIISMARSLGMNVIAEGVETAEQLAFIQAEGCEEAQGHYFSPALRLDDLLTWIDAHQAPGQVDGQEFRQF